MAYTGWQWEIFMTITLTNLKKISHSQIKVSLLHSMFISKTNEIEIFGALIHSKTHYYLQTFWETNPLKLSTNHFKNCTYHMEQLA